MIYFFFGSAKSDNLMSGITFFFSSQPIEIPQCWKNQMLENNLTTRHTATGL